MSRVIGRSDDMIIIRGVNVFPSQIEHVLMRIEGTEPHYVIVVDRKAASLDDLEVMVEVEQSFFTDETRGLEALREKIAKAIHDELGVSARIKLVEPKTIERSQGKAKRVIDTRHV